MLDRSISTSVTFYCSAEEAFCLETQINLAGSQLTLARRRFWTVPS